MVNIQDEIVNSGEYKTFKVDDLLFVDYRCLVEEDHSDVWAHDNYLAYVLGGEKKWKTPTNQIKVKSGDALFIKKGANTVYNYIDKPFIVLFVFIPDHFIRHVVLKHEDLELEENYDECQDNSLVLLSLNNLLESFFQSLIALFSESAVFSKNILKLKMEELVLNVLTQPGNSSLKQYFLTLSHHQKVDISDVMRNNYFRQLSINDFARLSARSISTFRRDFKRTFGTVPGRWLINKRLEYGRFLLENTDQPVSEIMDNCGFKDRSHFTKVFKETFGLSPNKYRTMKSIEVV